VRIIGAVGNDGPVQTVTVVGIGADGWAGLAEPGRAAVRAAEVVLGGPRQLELVAGQTKADARPWPSPMLPALPGLFAELADRRVCVLASGDPMLHGIGATLARLLGPDRLHVVPHPSSVSLACAGRSTGSRSSARSPGRSPGCAACSRPACGCSCSAKTRRRPVPSPRCSSTPGTADRR
jgi:hypothetical protein